MLMRVGAALRIERRLYFDDLGAKLDCHLRDDVIAPDAQRNFKELRRNMPIAEVPSHAGGLQRISAANLKKRLRCGNDFYQPPVLQDERIPAAQPSRVRQIK